MPRIPVLNYDRGTLILYPPPPGKAWIDFATWDDRIERFRIPAIHYRELVERLHRATTEFSDRAKGFEILQLDSRTKRTPYPHQSEALAAWKRAGGRGVVVLPTGSGKTYLAHMVLQEVSRSCLIVVPTLDLMHQWYEQLVVAFPDTSIGLLGGGSHDRTPILVATYDSAAIHAESLGGKFGGIVFDECHHLPSDFNRVIAEYAIAPYRLGLTATPERSDGRHEDLKTLIGPEVYRKSAADLAGRALADYEIVQLRVKLTTEERDRYEALLKTRNNFLQSANIRLGYLQGWQQFVRASAQSTAGRRAMLAHREAKQIALGTSGKLRILIDLLQRHDRERVLIFTNDNATVYRISQDFLIPAITHQTPVKERHVTLEHFREGTYRTLVVSHVLNEGVDVPEVKVAVLLSGTGSTREYVQRLGRILRQGKDRSRQAVLYEVIAENTVEERTSDRRSGGHNKRKPVKPFKVVPKHTSRKVAESAADFAIEDLPF